MKKNSFQKISAICIIIDIITIIAILIIRKSLPPIIPLFYGLPISESVLTPNIELIIPPTISIIFISINLGLNSLLKDSFLQQILGGLSIALSALSLITVIKIVLLIA